MSAPRMPSSLRPPEQRAWKQIVEELGGSAALATSDGTLLRAMAILTARLEDIRAFLAKSAEREEGLDYLMTETARGFTGNPLLGHERETIKELRLLQERMAKVLQARALGHEERPQSLRAMRDHLRVAK